LTHSLDMFMNIIQWRMGRLELSD